MIAGSADVAKVDALSIEAFPIEERLPTDMQVELCGRGELDLWAVYDGEVFVGFTTVFPRKGIAYVFFLAIDGSVRSKGYGGRLLALIKGEYAGSQVIIDIEPLDGTAPNAEQRVRRKAFYVRNGFRESGYLFKYLGMTFEVMYAGGDALDRDGYWDVIMDIKRMADEYSLGDFDPVLEKIA